MDENTGLPESTISGAETESENSGRKFTIAVIAVVSAVMLYLVYHLFSFVFNGYDTEVKREFSQYEESVILSEIEAVLPEDAVIDKAKYTGGKDPVLMVWVEGIDDGMDFIENYTCFDSMDYKTVSVALSQTQSAAARYYVIKKNGDEKPAECYLYKPEENDSWTAYFIENDVTDSSIKEIFFEEDE